MFARKAVSFLLALSLATAPALAHGNGGCKGRRACAEGTACTVCTAEGCTQAGRHTHRGVTYCGYAHEGGVCDGSCLEAEAQAPVEAPAQAPVEAPAQAPAAAGHHAGHHGGHHH